MLRANDHDYRPWERKSDSFQLTPTLVRTIQPLKGLFGARSKTTNIRQESQALHPQHIVTVEPNSQDALFGQSTCLHGQLACVWILAETLNEIQVKHLHSMGKRIIAEIPLVSFMNMQSFTVRC